MLSLDQFGQASELLEKYGEQEAAKQQLASVLQKASASDVPARIEVSTPHIAVGKAIKFTGDAADLAIAALTEIIDAEIADLEAKLRALGVEPNEEPGADAAQEPASTS
ncbi:MAG: hypothetical protein AAGF32_03420 [Pseudomonadota bacterium]